MSDAVIQTFALAKDFGDLHALDGIDLEVDRGEVFGFLGPNGAGKTTTIRLLLDFLRPTSGSTRVLGGAGADPAVRKRIGYLPGDLHIDRKYTGNDIISFFGRVRGGVDQAFAKSLVDRFELDPGRPSGELSTGNRRKIGIVQAFMSRPELLILDEPTSGLDPLLQNEFQRLVHETVAGGATVFLSSHALPEVEALADRVGILRKGKLVATATLDELQQRARQRIELHIDGAFDIAAFQRAPGVVSATVAGNIVHLVVEGSVDGAVKAASAFTVSRFVSHGADLEDMFLAYYEEGSK